MGFLHLLNILCKTWGACVSFLCFCAFFLDQTKHALITIWYQLVIFLSCPISLFTIVDPWKETTWSWNCQLTFAIVKRITRWKGKLKIIMNHSWRIPKARSEILIVKNHINKIVLYRDIISVLCHSHQSFIPKVCSKNILQLFAS